MINPMRLFKKLMMAVAAVPLFTACMDNSNTYSAIFGVSANGGSPVFANTGHAFATLGSFGSWHIEQNSGSDWCSLDMMRGAGNAYYSIPARFKLNTTDLYRVASFTARDDENPDDVYATITFRQYGTRIDGSLGSAALVTGITGDDGTEITIGYDTLCRPVDLEMRKNGTRLRQLAVTYAADDSSYFMNVVADNDRNNELTADCSFAYQPSQLVSSTDTVGYYEQSTWIVEGDAFNVEEHRPRGEVTAQALLFTKGSISQKGPDSLQTADSLRYLHRYTDGTSYREDLRLSYSQNSNRRQSVDVNQLLLGVEECNPYQLISLFRLARNSYVISEAEAADGKYTVATTLNGDGSVSTMTVTDKQGGTVTYTFTYDTTQP